MWCWIGNGFMPYCVRCGKEIPDGHRDGVCSEDCWLELFKGNSYDYFTGVSIADRVKEYVEKNRL